MQSLLKTSHRHFGVVKQQHIFVRKPLLKIVPEQFIHIFSISILWLFLKSPPHSIDQRWLLFATKVIESAANNATRPQWQCSPRVFRPFLAHWVPGIILCTGKFICALKHICALKNIFVHWKIHLCTEKHIFALKIIFVHWETCWCIRNWNCELNKLN